jgi:hypothetical protein
MFYIDSSEFENHSMLATTSMGPAAFAGWPESNVVHGRDCGLVEPVSHETRQD